MITRQKLIDQIEKYKPYNEQEEKDKILILNWIRNNENAFSRENAVAHMTASAWVVNRERTKVLMVYHNIYNSWSWLGGHADGETDLLAVALREVKEEAGIANVRPVRCCQRSKRRGRDFQCSSGVRRDFFPGISDCRRPYEKRKICIQPFAL